MKWKVLKRATAKFLAMFKPGAAAPPNFSILDDGNGTFTVVGTDSAGNQIPIPAGVATLAISSSDTTTPPTYLTFALTTGMSFTATPTGIVTPANSPVVLTATVTWTAAPIPAGSPFSGTADFTVSPDPNAITGVVVTAG